MDTHTSTDMQTTYTLFNTHTHTHTHTHRYAHTLISSLNYSLKHTYIHAHTDFHTHTHTCRCQRGPAGSDVASLPFRRRGNHILRKQTLTDLPPFSYLYLSAPLLHLSLSLSVSLLVLISLSFLPPLLPWLMQPAGMSQPATCEAPRWWQQQPCAACGLSGPHRAALLPLSAMHGRNVKKRIRGVTLAFNISLFYLLCLSSYRTLWFCAVSC